MHVCIIWAAIFAILIDVGVCECFVTVMTAEMMLAGVKESDKEKTVEAWKLLFSRFYRVLEQVKTLILCKKMLFPSKSNPIKVARASKKNLPGITISAVKKRSNGGEGIADIYCCDSMAMNSSNNDSSNSSNDPTESEVGLVNED